MVYGLNAFNSVFKYHRASLYGDKVIVLDIMLFTSQRVVLSRARTAQPCL
jgi:hypothetical protein